MLSIHFYSFSFSHSILISSFLYQYSIFYYDYDIVDFNRNTIIEMKMMIWIEHNSQYNVPTFSSHHSMIIIKTDLIWSLNTHCIQIQSDPFVVMNPQQSNNQQTTHSVAQLINSESYASMNSHTRKAFYYVWN